MWLILLMVLLFPVADYVEVGLGVHNPNLDQPEFVIVNPLGTYESGMHMSKKIDVFYRHVSSVPYDEVGGGLNTIGIKYKLK